MSARRESNSTHFLNTAAVRVQKYKKKRGNNILHVCIKIKKYFYEREKSQTVAVCRESDARES